LDNDVVDSRRRGSRRGWQPLTDPTAAGNAAHSNPNANQAKIRPRLPRPAKVFGEVSELLDTRLYKWRQVARAIEDRGPESELRRR
jgi:hypothetical protein